MARETIDAKGRRYLTEGRLQLLEVSDRTIRATCRGAGEEYALGWNGADGWWCGCPSARSCAHLVALRLVTIVARPALPPCRVCGQPTRDVQRQVHYRCTREPAERMP